MAQQTTPNLNLVLPYQSENVEVNDINDNYTKIDTAYGQIANRFKTISSGSLHDIKATGMYYLTGGVTDKPTGNGGFYSVTAYNSGLLVGVFSNTDGLTYNVVYTNNTWYYNQIANNDRIIYKDHNVSNITVPSGKEAYLNIGSESGYYPITVTGVFTGETATSLSVLNPSKNPNDGNWIARLHNSHSADVVANGVVTSVWIKR